MTQDRRLFRWWQEAPQLARRFYWRMCLLPLVVLALIAAGLAMDLFPRLGFVTSISLLVALSALLVLWVFAIGRWEQRLVQRLEAADYRVCPRCGYDLTGHEGRFNCPECGTAGDLARVQAAWRSFRPTITGGAA